jgi:hypothetical protein
MAGNGRTRALLFRPGVRRAGKRLYESKHHVHDVEPDAHGTDDQRCWRDSGAWKSTVGVGGWLQVRPSQPAVSLSSRCSNDRIGSARLAPTDIARPIAWLEEVAVSRQKIHPPPMPAAFARDWTQATQRSAARIRSRRFSVTGHLTFGLDPPKPLNPRG